jgi:hypothetical protein
MMFAVLCSKLVKMQVSQLRIKFFSKRQENFRAKSQSRKERQALFGSEFKIPAV